MIKKTIEVSSEGVFLSSRNKQLVIKRDGLEPATIPCEDIQLLMLDAPNSIISHGALSQLLENNASLVVCGRNHLPSGILIPFSTHNQVLTRLNLQLDVSKPLKKKLWKTIVQHKIENQAALLMPKSPEKNRLNWLAKDVKSGDSENHEAQAASVYWRHWLPPSFDFRRNAEDEGINSLLNYGYAVLRASIARACVMAGLLPALGIHHHNRSNAFCLADDLIEPLRPLVDWRVRKLVESSLHTISPETKKEILSLLQFTVKSGENKGPLAVHIHIYVSSFVKSIQEGEDFLEIPSWIYQDTDSCG